MFKVLNQVSGFSYFSTLILALIYGRGVSMERAFRFNLITK